MSFILCRQEEVTHPLYIEALGVHISPLLVKKEKKYNSL